MLDDDKYDKKFSIQKTRKRLAEEHNVSKKMTFLDAFDDKIISQISFLFESDLWKHVSEIKGFNSHYLVQRSKIVEITQSQKCTFIRTSTGLGAVVNTMNCEFICFLNNFDGELIKSIYYNKVKNDIIKVNISLLDDYSALHCYVYNESDLKNCKCLFDNNEIVYPGFVEFDSINNRAIILEGKKKDYKIWDLTNYSMLYELKSYNIWDLKMTPGALLLIKSNKYNEIELTFIGNGKNTTTSKIRTFNNMNIEFVDRFELTIFYKEKEHDVNVIDLSDNSYTSIPKTSNLDVSNFIFLYKSKKLIIYFEGEFKVYSFLGEYLFSIFNTKSFDNFPIGIAKNQNYLVTCTQKQFDQWIYIYSLKDGSLIFEKYFPPQVSNGYKITSISFDDTNNIMTIGNEIGCLWFYG